MFKLASPLQFKHLLTAVSFIIFGCVTRYLLRDLPNVETITAVSLLAGALLGARWAIVVGLTVVAITDIFIGNTNILIYTWSAWALLGLLGLVMRRAVSRPARFAAGLTGLGLVSNVLFFAWTNFGVWQLSGMYPQTVDGLLQSYLMGLPFLKQQLLSTLLFVPALSVVAAVVWNRTAVKAPQLIQKPVAV